MTAGSPARCGPRVVMVELMTFEASCEWQVAVVLIGAVRALGPMAHVVPDDAEDGTQNRDAAERSEELLPDLDEEGNVRIRRQAVPLGMVAVREDRDDARSVDAGRIVERRLRESVFLELLDPGMPHDEHVLLRPEVEAAGRAR